MVDLSTRTEFAEQIRHLVSGQISNDEFEDRLPESKDKAIREIFWNGVWGLYDDLKEHKLRGPFRIDKKYRGDIARWILFLKSDLEYEWPPYPPKPQIINILLSIATLGIYNRIISKYWQKNGEVDVWPFIRRSDYEKALSN